MANTRAPTPFWNVNVPRRLHTAECPDFLQYALVDEKDRTILSTQDAQYHRQSWELVQELIRTNRIDLFQRLPSDLRRYRDYCAKLVREYGSVMEFVMRERLRWKELRPAGAPFENAGTFIYSLITLLIVVAEDLLTSELDDLKILYNDWPYGVDSRIAHLVVWTKFELASDPATDDLTPEARKEIDDYVNATFVSRCGREKVIWFKNWSSLKSIHAVEHFHVMLFDADAEFLKGITGDDVPLAEKVGRPNAT